MRLDRIVPAAGGTGMTGARNRAEAAQVATNNGWL